MQGGSIAACALSHEGLKTVSLSLRSQGQQCVGFWEESYCKKNGTSVYACETPRQRCLILQDQYFMTVEFDIPNLIKKK